MGREYQLPTESRMVNLGRDYLAPTFNYFIQVEVREFTCSIWPAGHIETINP